MGSFSIWHWLIVLAIVLIIFGTGKISNLMGDFGKGINAFKKGLKEEDDAKAPGNKTIEQNSGAGATTDEKKKAKEEV